MVLFKRFERILFTLILLMAGIIVVIQMPHFTNLESGSLLTPHLQAFVTIFLAIAIEATPFILLGIFGSAFLEVFVSEKALQKVLPKNPYIGTPLAGLLGILFPFCECGMVPIARRLLLKGVRPSQVFPFMLAAPIINPITAISTYYAFYGQMDMVALRFVGAFVIVLFVGYILLVLEKRKGEHNLRTEIIRPQAKITTEACGCSHGHSSCGQSHGHHHHHGQNSTIKSILSKTNNFLRHAVDEFFTVGAYLLVGAALAAAAQVWLPQSSLQVLGQETLLAVLTMMLLGFALSICTAADAFVAAGFVGTFTPGAILTFLIFGPMIDVKNTLMMLGFFRRSYVFLLIAIVSTAALLVGLSIDTFFF
ncbi:permease [Heliorestis convoluta]|uniref:Putative permease family protein n=1 Tax=Heliorestis convoluta TaxID=356322 RepID=A0A5Q2MVV7_9FIRM|nr:permease [Heliorestis convoluta]QGG46397.1 putative permease family protein [Heliorestis convoluta]